jgi:hypothetical protein
LEERGDIAPYSITIGIYHLLMHTHFCATVEVARKDYQMFKTKIEEILELDGEDTEKCNQKIDELISII